MYHNILAKGIVASVPPRRETTLNRCKLSPAAQGADKSDSIE